MQPAQEIHIDTSLIPDEVRDSLAASVLELVLGILRQPGGREALDAETAKRKAAQMSREVPPWQSS